MKYFIIWGHNINLVHNQETIEVIYQKKTHKRKDTDGSGRQGCGRVGVGQIKNGSAQLSSLNYLKHSIGTVIAMVKRSGFHIYMANQTSVLETFQLKLCCFHHLNPRLSNILKNPLIHFWSLYHNSLYQLLLPFSLFYTIQGHIMMTPIVAISTLNIIVAIYILLITH